MSTWAEPSKDKLILCHSHLGYFWFVSKAFLLIYLVLRLDWPIELSLPTRFQLLGLWKCNAYKVLAWLADVQGHGSPKYALEALFHRRSLIRASMWAKKLKMCMRCQFLIEEAIWDVCDENRKLRAFDFCWVFDLDVTNSSN